MNYAETYFFGFVGEINASSSCDIDLDSISYQWIAPLNMQVSSTNNSIIKFLCPIVKEPSKVEFILMISDGKETQSKIIDTKILPYKPELEEAKISEIEASLFQEPNSPLNINDEDIVTLWAANGDNQWLVLHLKTQFKVDLVKLAFQPEMMNVTFFDILGSQDDLKWDSILVRSSSCGFSGNFHVFDFPLSMTEVEYSFIKLVGHGNSINTWNYFSEFKINGHYSDDFTLLTQYQMTIYPNPAKDCFNISLQKPALVTVIIKIANLLGRIVFDEKINSGVNELSIPVGFANGIYIVELCSDRLIYDCQKLIIEK